MLVGKIVYVLLTLAANVLIARHLGPAGKGVVAISLLVPTLVALLSSLGLGNANIFFSSKRAFEISEIVGNSALLSIGFGMTLTLLLLCLIPILGTSLLRDYPSALLYQSLPLILLTLASEYFGGIFIGLRMAGAYATARIGRSLSHLGFVFLFVVVLQLGVTGGVLSGVLCVAVEILLFGYFLLKKGLSLFPRYRAQVLRETAKFGLKGHFGTIFQYFNYRLDMFIVAYFLSPRAVGLYSIAVLMAEIILYFPTAVSRILMAKVASRDFETSNVFTPLVCRVTLAVSLTGAFILLTIGPAFISRVFTISFSPAVVPLNLLLPGVVALALWKVIINDLSGRGLPQYKSYATGVSLIVTVILDLWLIPPFGIAGAAVASSVAYISTLVLSAYWFTQVSGVRIWDLFLIRSEDIAVSFRGAKSLLVGSGQKPQKEHRDWGYVEK
jgi:O-antigen/teichoic acid export membrane protein